MSWSDRIRRLVFGDPAPRAAAMNSPVVPTDAVALQLVLRQVALDEVQAAQQYARGLGGQGGFAAYLAGAGERERRRAIARKVRRREPVTQWEIICATTGLANTLGPTGDAIRLALAFDGRSSGSTPSAPLP